MDEQHTDVLVRLNELRGILADLRGRFSANPVGGPVDPELLQSAQDGLEAVSVGFSLIETTLTERLAQESIREDDWFREMAAVIPEGVFKLDSDGVVVYANDVLLDMFDLTQADLASGLNIKDFLADGEFERVRQVMIHLAGDRKPQPTRYRARRRGGDTFIMETLGALTRDAGGAVAGLWGVARDVTLEHRAEKIARARVNLRVALATADDVEQAMGSVLDAALRMEGVDSGCVYVAGPGAKTFDLIASRGLSEGFVRAMADRATDPRHGGRTEGLPSGMGISVTREDILNSPDLSTREEGLHSLAMVPMWHDERPLAMVVVASHKEDEIPPGTRDALEDLVSQVSSAIVRIGAEQARRQAVETFETVFRTVPLAIYIMDIEGRLVMWNEAATRMFGWTEAEVLGKPPLFVPEEKRDEFTKMFEQGVYHGGPLLGLEVERRRKDGSPVFIRLWSSILHDDKGRPTGILSTAEDITEKRLAEQTQQRVSRLESLGVLAGGIAHDFNNVLMGITGNINLARSETDATVRAELLDEAQDAAASAVKLTAQLLTFAKGGAPVKDVMDVSALVRDVLDLALVGSPVRPELDLQATLSVQADPVQIREVIQSLVLNALDAMPEGGTLTVATDDVSDGPDARFVRIAISDTGLGIGADKIERIFDPYFTTKSAGTGLGLSVAHSIVAQHGGRITVESAPGAGATFEVLLPATTAVQEAPQLQRPAAAAQDDGIRVLVVDDEEMVRTILIRMLDRWGYSGVPCASGEEAIRLSREAAHEGNPFDIVITDLTMPGGLGGIETTQSLRELDPNVLVVVSSGYSDDPAIARFSDYGFSASVKKPYTLDALRETLESCCVRRPTQK
jgi:PAS domain S-box-containing protein